MIEYNKVSEEPKLTSLCSDPQLEAHQEYLFNIAEQWLNSLGISTRTQYYNVLPTYNLFLNIGEYLERKHKTIQHEE